MRDKKLSLPKYSTVVEKDSVISEGGLILITTQMYHINSAPSPTPKIRDDGLSLDLKQHPDGVNSNFTLWFYHSPDHSSQYEGNSATDSTTPSINLATGEIKGFQSLEQKFQSNSYPYEGKSVYALPHSRVKRNDGTTWGEMVFFYPTVTNQEACNILFLNENDSVPSVLLYNSNTSQTVITELIFDSNRKDQMIIAI